jgi:hypothetical protein
MPRQATKCACFYCGDDFKVTDWNKQMKSLHNEYGWRYTQARQTELYYELSPHIGGDGMCRSCFKTHLHDELADIKNHLQQGIEPH